MVPLKADGKVDSAQVSVYNFSSTGGGAGKVVKVMTVLSVV